MTILRVRTFALLLVLATITTACSAAADLADEVATEAGELRSEIVGDDPAPGPANQDGPAGTTAPDGGGQPPAEDPPAASDPPAPALPPTDDRGSLGTLGPAILRADIPRLIIEVDVQEGVTAPTALDHLGSILGSVAEKPAGIVFAGGNTFASDRRDWSRDDLRAAADANRSNFSGPDGAVIYLLYVRGGFFRDGEETTAVGVAHSASEAAVFPERWQSLTTALLGGDAAVERAVVVHEVGHLLGLVNLTYESDIDHEDEANPGHSNSESSVMFWAVDSTALAQVFNGPPPADFDAADRSDLEGLRTGRLG